MSSSQDLSILIGDADFMSKVDESVQLWAKMCVADIERQSKLRGLLERLHEKAEARTVELMDCLDRLALALNVQAGRFLGAASALASQIRSAVREDRDSALRRLAAVEQDLEAQNRAQLHLHSQVWNLQDDRRALQLRMEQMVSRSAMVAMQQDAEERASELRYLERELAQHRHAAEGLNARLSEAEAEKADLLSKMQVRLPR
jgi:chromosome segregation ATPase